MRLRMCQVHAVTFDGLADAADEYDGPVNFHVFHHADVRERIIRDAVSIGIPGVVKKYQVTNLDRRSPMYDAVCAYMVKDKADAICLVALMDAVVQVDSMREIYGTCHSSAVIGDAPAAARNGSCSDEFRRRASDRVVMGIVRRRSTTIPRRS
jgi:hypothetical protein